MENVLNPWINYHHLFYFKTIAEEGTVSKAAEKLRIGQPTLSAQLKHFEDNLGVQLFERQQKRLVLTEQGKVALDYARNIFKMGAEMYEVLHDRLKTAKTAICIGALDTIPKQITLQLVKAAVKIAPCQITLVEGKPDELIRELSAHRVDLLLTNFVPTAKDGRDLFHRSLIKNNVNVYGAAKYKPLRKGFPKSISDQPLILPTYDSKLRYDLDHWSKTIPIDLDIFVESQDISVKKLLATEGFGLLPAASHTVSVQVRSGQLFEIGQLQGVSEELFFVTAKRKMENQIAKELMKNFEVKL